MSLGQQIRRFRAQKNLRQVELSRLIGMDQKQLSVIELDKHDPRWKTVLRIAAGLGVTPNDLADWKGKGEEWKPGKT